MAPTVWSRTSVEGALARRRRRVERFLGCCRGTTTTSRGRSSRRVVPRASSPLAPPSLRLPPTVQGFLLGRPLSCCAEPQEWPEPCACFSAPRARVSCARCVAWPPGPIDSRVAVAWAAVLFRRWCRVLLRLLCAFLAQSCSRWRRKSRGVTVGRGCSRGAPGSRYGRVRARYAHKMGDVQTAVQTSLAFRHAFHRVLGVGHRKRRELASAKHCRSH